MNSFWRTKLLTLAAVIAVVGFTIYYSTANSSLVATAFSSLAIAILSSTWVVFLAIKLGLEALRDAILKRENYLKSAGLSFSKELERLGEPPPSGVVRGALRKAILHYMGTERSFGDIVARRPILWRLAVAAFLFIAGAADWLFRATPFSVVAGLLAVWSAADAAVIAYRVRRGLFGDIPAEVMEAAKFVIERSNSGGGGGFDRVFAENQIDIATNALDAAGEART